MTEPLVKAVQFKTISNYDSSQVNYSYFDQFIHFLETEFPLVQQHLERIIINRYSIIYHWKGTNGNFKPFLFSAHYDVVPVDSSSLNEWINPPFSGNIESNFIWGRGSVDDKFSLISLMETVEKLLVNHYQPKHDIWFSFGHDEEIGGSNGAFNMAKYYRDEKLKFQFILDEGGIVTNGIFPGIKAPIAFIGTAEKVDINIALSVHGKGGHSSVPSKNNVITILSRAIDRLMTHPMHAKLQEPTIEMMQHLKPYVNGRTKFAVNHLRLFNKKILKIFTENDVMNSLVRTVMSATIFKSGVKENASPVSAYANINVRIIQGDSLENVIQHIKNVIADERVTITVKSMPIKPSQISSTQSKIYKILEENIHEYFPGTIVSPLLSIGATDSRHYSNLSENILRFIPTVIDNKNMEMVHGINEKVPVKDVDRAVLFYETLIKKADEMGE